MAKTKSDLATKVLRNLRIVRRAGGVPNAADSQFVQDEYTDVFQELKDDGKIWWDDADSIPDRAFPALAKVIAGLCADAFGRPDYDPGDAYQRLTRMASRDDFGFPTEIEYF